MGFILGSVAGLVGLTVLNIYSKRIVHRIYLHQSGRKASITFMSALWKPRTLEYNITEFAGVFPSYGNFYRSEITSLGNIWLMLESNRFGKEKAIVSVLDEVLHGREVQVASGNVFGFASQGKPLN